MHLFQHVREGNSYGEFDPSTGRAMTLVTPTVIMKDQSSDGALQADRRFSFLPRLKGEGYTSAHLC
jgi:hypothetical protein